MQDALTEYQPYWVINLLRITLFLQAYMYHSSIGLMHLSRVLFSFIANDRVFFFTAASVMLPIYTWEFLIGYGMRTPGIKEIEPFLSCSEYFVREMAAPVVEQSITFLTLILLYMSIGCLKMAYQVNQEN